MPLKVVYVSGFHSIMKYNLRSNFSERNKVFFLRTEIIKIMAVVEKRETYTKLFKEFHILPLACENFLTFISFIIA
jgi:hypothetical protein